MPSKTPARAFLSGLLVVLLAAGGWGAWRWQAWQAAQREAAIAAFSLNAAMSIAGKAVPPEVESLYFFVLDPARENESGELADTLVRAAGKHEFLAITGADPLHNRAVVGRALELVGQHNLAGLVMVYVGPPEQQAELATRVQATGAELRFVSDLLGEGQTL